MITHDASGYKRFFGQKSLPQSDAAKPILILDGNSAEQAHLSHEMHALFGDAPVKAFRNGALLLDYLTGVKLSRLTKTVKRPRLILMDLYLPDMDGLWTLKRIRKDADFADIPVVVLSDTYDQDEINKVYQYGANAFINKPFSRYEFMQILHHNAGFSDAL